MSRRFGSWEDRSRRRPFGHRSIAGFKVSQSVKLVVVFLHRFTGADLVSDAYRGSGMPRESDGGSRK